MGAAVARLSRLLSRRPERARSRTRPGRTFSTRSSRSMRLSPRATIGSSASRTTSFNAAHGSSTLSASRRTCMSRKRIGAAASGGRSSPPSSAQRKRQERRASSGAPTRRTRSRAGFTMRWPNAQASFNTGSNRSDEGERVRKSHPPQTCRRAEHPPCLRVGKKPPAIAPGR